MSNALYPKFKETLLQAGINLSAGNLKAIPVNLTAGDGAGNFYTYNAAHEFLTSVPAGARVAAGVTLANRTFTNGVLDADDIVFPSVTGFTIEAVILYVDTGTEATSRLVAFIDTAGTSLPVTPNGGNITIAWDSGAVRIFAL